MIIIYDSRIPQAYVNALKDFAPFARLHPLTISSRGSVYDSILCHPDIYFFRLDEKALVHSPSVPFALIEQLKREGLELIKGENVPSGRYPGTAPYNVVRVGNMLFHNLKYTDPAILNEAAKRGIRCVSVEQGYARCSVVPVGEKAVITADVGIAKVMEKEGIDVLLVGPGHVELPGEKCGFLGGASGNVTGRNGVVFLGDIDCYPDALRIKNFCAKHGVSVFSPKGLELYDAGSLLIVGSRCFSVQTDFPGGKFSN